LISIKTDDRRRKGGIRMIEYPKYKRVLFCTDFSENSDCAFDYAFGVAKRDGGLLYILHVIPNIPNQYYAALYSNPENFEKIQAAIREDLEQRYNDQYLRQIKDKTKVNIVTKSGREDEEILKFVRKEHIDIIVIGTHGRTGIKHAVFGSVAEKIIRYSPIPVFVIPCKKKSGRA
jgi:nucleotide-binding universal stress UspA family protein